MWINLLAGNLHLYIWTFQHLFIVQVFGRIDLGDHTFEWLSQAHIVNKDHIIYRLIIKSVLGSLSALHEWPLLLLHLHLLLLFGSGSSTTTSILRWGELTAAHLCIIKEINRMCRYWRSNHQLGRLRQILLRQNILSFLCRFLTLIKVAKLRWSYTLDDEWPESVDAFEIITRPTQELLHVCLILSIEHYCSIRVQFTIVLGR